VRVFPAIELVLGDAHPPLGVAAWDPRLAWTDDVPTSRPAPRYLVGVPQWNRLVPLLQRHGVL